MKAVRLGALALANSYMKFTCVTTVPCKVIFCTQAQTLVVEDQESTLRKRVEDDGDEFLIYFRHLLYKPKWLHTGIARTHEML